MEKPTMKLFAIAPIAVAAIALSLTPVKAQWSGQSSYGYDQSYNSGWNNGGWNNDQSWNGRRNNGWNNGWNSRNVSDPSFYDRRGINAARRTGRCVADLGYGRYEYCGW
jgi:hypothetical protein